MFGIKYKYIYPFLIIKFILFIKKILKKTTYDLFFNKFLKIKFYPKYVKTCFLIKNLFFVLI